MVENLVKVKPYKIMGNVFADNRGNVKAKAFLVLYEFTYLKRKWVIHHPTEISTKLTISDKETMGNALGLKDFFSYEKCLEEFHKTLKKFDVKSEKDFEGFVKKYKEIYKTDQMFPVWLLF